MNLLYLGARLEIRIVRIIHYEDEWQYFQYYFGQYNVDEQVKINLRGCIQGDSVQFWQVCR